MQGLKINNFCNTKTIDFLYYKNYNKEKNKGSFMKKVGRPKGDNNLIKTYTIRIDNETHNRLEIYCKLKKIAKSKAIRTAINTMIDESETLTNKSIKNKGDKNE